MRALIRSVDALERLSRWLTLAAFFIAVSAFVAAPILALAWSKQPFPGFLIEHVLVVTDRDGQGWTGRALGLGLPQQVIRFAGVDVASPSDFQRAISGLESRDRVPIFTRTPDGATKLYPAVEMMGFPAQDFSEMFWLPYLIGLAYLAIGVWIYLARGRTRPGRALAFFCACTALVCGLLFDSLTTHLGSAIWAFAMALLGGAVISLALRFPDEWKPVKRWPWLLGAPYIVSIAVGVWNLITLGDPSNPWAYLDARRTSFLYAALGAAVFLGVMLHRSRTSLSSVSRRQARLVFLGAAIAFTPVVAWFVSPQFGLDLPFRGSVLLPGLIVFPLSVGLAILRYRLLEIDSIVNRALVYAVLTAVLAGAFTALIALTQRLFVNMTGERSDAAIVMTTLIVAAASAPLRARLQAFVDSQFRETPGTTRVLEVFGDQVRLFVQMHDPLRLTQRLLEEAVHGLHAQSGAIVLQADGSPRTTHTVGQWTGEAWSSIPLTWQGDHFGALLLGPRARGGQYTLPEVEGVQHIVNEVAHAIWLAGRRGDHLHGSPAEGGQAAGA